MTNQLINRLIEKHSEAAEYFSDHWDQDLEEIAQDPELVRIFANRFNCSDATIHRLIAHYRSIATI